uniref:Uncharacterized protein n=1 Tax=Oryza brachyantha TaxID=4533 RepID=J3LA78_ORYBR
MSCLNSEITRQPCFVEKPIKASKSTCSLVSFEAKNFACEAPAITDIPSGFRTIRVIIHFRIITREKCVFHRVSCIPFGFQNAVPSFC